MSRVLLLLAGILVLTFFEYSFYPGHTYSIGDSQSTVAALERLDQPGFLSRDLAATNPDLTYTIYDEVTLFLHRATGKSIESVLQAQQIIERTAALLGVAVFCLTAGTGLLTALVTAALVNLGVVLPGLSFATTDSEPTAVGFSLSFTILGLALLAGRKPLLASLAGGVAFAYEPFIAGIFWLLVLGNLISDRSQRPLHRATVPAFVVFALLLANASQLQSGFAESPNIFGRMSGEWAHLQQLRVPQLWVSTWSGPALFFYLTVNGAGIYAFASVRKTIPLVARILLFPIAIGLLSLPVSLLLVEGVHCSFAGEAQVLRSLALAVICSLLLMLLAAAHNIERQHWSAACLWIAPVLAVLIAFRQTSSRGTVTGHHSEIKSIASWARDNTWGASLFVFPDAGRSALPGLFRVYSMRAVYIDWQSRELIRVFPEYAKEWDKRWRDTSSQQFSRPVLHRLLTLPIDYVVLSRAHQLPGVRAELVTEDFVVYDAHLLQTILPN